MTAAGKARPAGRRFGLVDLLRQAGRMTLRDWRAGELTLVALALVLAVAALTSVGFLADRLRQGLERDARRMLGADFVVRADHPVDPAFAHEARTLGLATATTAVFPSMVGAAKPADSADSAGSAKAGTPAPSAAADGAGVPA
ncbi:ABC transporter permease, partial [Burkholderia pseudomallei]|nr:ABC transporter permease [Burkholderia pseudomallei]